MKLILAVIDDLYTFARDILAKFFVGRDTRTLNLLESPVIYVPGSVPHPALSLPNNSLSAASTPSRTAEAVESEPTIAPQRNTIVYTQAGGAPLRSNPDTGSDTVLAKIPYGAMLVALETNDGWVRVFHRGVEGWVLLQDLADRAAAVYPKFIIGEKNLADDPNTERVRAIIEDEFSYGEGMLPLQAEEYVLYKLRRRGAEVKWTLERPRKAGSWTRIMSEARGAIASDEPKQRAVMEWTLENGRGHVAYVEAVFPDGSIQISEANWPADGIYNERVLVRDEWQRLKPKFLVIA